MFEWMTAIRTRWNLIGFAELLHVRVNRCDEFAVNALNFARCTVEFVDGLASGDGVQSINVLGNGGGDVACSFPFGYQIVGDVRARFGEVIVSFGLLTPILMAGFGAVTEILVIDGLVLRPNATW